MSEKPEALRLADALENGTYLLSVERVTTAAELRRQHDEIEQLREQNTTLDAACAKLKRERDELLGALKWISNRCPAHMEDSLLHPIHQEMAHDAGACARAAIAKCQ